VLREHTEEGRVSPSRSRWTSKERKGERKRGGEHEGIGGRGDDH
jgi:hypothetical protein